MNASGTHHHHRVVSRRGLPGGIANACLLSRTEGELSGFFRSAPPWRTWKNTSYLLSMLKILWRIVRGTLFTSISPAWHILSPKVKYGKRLKHSSQLTPPKVIHWRMPTEPYWLQRKRLKPWTNTWKQKPSQISGDSEYDHEILAGCMEDDMTLCQPVCTTLFTINFTNFSKFPTLVPNFWEILRNW